MKNLGSLIPAFNPKITPTKASRVAMRAAQVKTMLLGAVRHCYHGAASAMLKHINAVYILHEDKNKIPKTTMVVYLDDANFRSDLIARQYFITLWIKQNHGETIDEFKALSSRGAMRERHAYSEEQLNEVRETHYSPKPLDSDSERTLNRWASDIQSQRLRKAFLKAARSDLGRYGADIS